MHYFFSTTNVVGPSSRTFWLNFQVDIDFEKEPIGKGKDGKDIYFRDIWPSTQEIAEVNGVCFSHYVKFTLLI